MAYFLLQAAYTPEAWAAQVKDPGSRLESLRPVVEKLGGKMDNAWLTFGDFDVVAIMQMPDNVSAAAFSIAAAAGGAVKAVKTTPMMSIEEGMEAMKKAGASGYRPPGS